MKPRRFVTRAVTAGIAAAAVLAAGCSGATSDAPANATPASGPCDWITTEEATSVLGGQVSARPHGEEPGSVEMSCGYSRGLGENGMESELKLPGAFPVYAASQFATSAANATPVDGVGVKAVCVSEPTTTPPSTTVSVLLSGDRIYRVTGWYAMSCETLTHVAQTAVGRIGP